MAAELSSVSAARTVSNTVLHGVTGADGHATWQCVYS